MLDGDPAPPNQGTAPTLFGPYLFWENGWMDQDATWYDVDLGPGQIVFDGDPDLHPERGTAILPPFQPMSIVAQRSPISATVEHLLRREQNKMQAIIDLQVLLHT